MTETIEIKKLFMVLHVKTRGSDKLLGLFHGGKKEDVLQSIIVTWYDMFLPNTLHDNPCFSRLTVEEISDDSNLS